ncbi:MAG: hypothetical protein GF320_04400 [Armatimonadia bacterium]|nr:hypothetical protein [Armatimonadia bacterium]
MIPLCVPVQHPTDPERAKAAGAEGVILVGDPAVRTACEKCDLPVHGMRPAACLPGSVQLPLVPPSTPPSRIILPPPVPAADDTRSMESIKAFRLRVVEVLEGIAAWAEDEGHTVCVGSRSDSFFEGALEITEVLRAVGSDSLLYALNTYDAEECGDGLSGSTDICGDILGHVVAEDRTGGARAVPGQGEIPFDRLFEQLDLLGYEGPVEVAATPDDWKGAIEHLARARP